VVERILDVEDRPEILAHALAFLDADRGFFSTGGFIGKRPVENHPEHQPARFASKLNVENVEAVIVRDAFGNGANSGKLTFDRHESAPKNKKWADAHWVTY
jgi:hypothetical protein